MLRMRFLSARSLGLCSLWLLLTVLETGAAAAEPGQCPSFAPGSTGLPTRTEWRTRPVLGDVNGDGHLDLAAHPRKAQGPQVFLGNGKGSWKNEGVGLALPGFGCGVGVDFADANGDGHLDLAVADHCHGLFVFLGDGEGRWRLAGRRGRLGRRVGREAVRFGDFDGDGHQDVLAVGSFHGGFSLFRGDGQGGFEAVPAATTGLPDDGTGSDIALGDINGDGRPDIAAAFSPGQRRWPSDENVRNMVWLSGPDGRWTAASKGLPVELEHRDVALADVNGDGHLDLATSTVPHGTDQRPIYVFLGDGQGGWTASSEGLPRMERGLSFNGVELADLDGDGHMDLVAATWLAPLLRVWRGDGAGGWIECGETALPASVDPEADPIRSWGVTAADVNHDGRLDLAAAFGKRGAGRLEVWLQQ